jgi:pimeloyl-ACP methyl ester carboxylesterase
MPRVPLLLLPGLLCDARLWRDQIEALSDIAVPTVADLSQDDTIERMAERAVAPMPERFAVAGLSMGGYVAFAILRLVPERVTAVCLLDTSARPDTPEQARRRRGLIALARRGRFRGVTPRLLPQLLHPARLSDETLTAEVMAMAERIGQDAFLRQQSAILKRPDSRPDLSYIRVPALVGVGEADALTPPDCAAEIAAGIVGAELRLIAGCGHLPSIERPEVVSGLMRSWICGGSVRNRSDTIQVHTRYESG